MKNSYSCERDNVIKQTNERINMIEIFVSGDRRAVASDTTIEKLLIAEKVEMPEYVSVSVNEQFVQREEFSSFVLRNGDEVEFLYYMGGGSI